MPSDGGARRSADAFDDAEVALEAVGEGRQRLLVCLALVCRDRLFKAVELDQNDAFGDSGARDSAGRTAEPDRAMRPEPRPAAHKVVVLAVDGIYPFELGIPQHVLGSAGGRYEVVAAGVDGKPVRTVSDLTVIPGHGPEVLAEADTVIIPGYAITQAPAAATDSKALDALSKVRPGTRLVSICSGAFLLAGGVEEDYYRI
jgi:hypothetical protein